MKLTFTKMHGLGNDFVVLDATRQPLSLSRDQLRLLADRYFGVGCDQILQVEPARTDDTDFYYRIFNADGGEVEQCGNGARCFVRFVVEKGLTQKREIAVETAGGVITLKLHDDNQVSVNMGAPIFEPAKIPFIAEEKQQLYVLALHQQIISICAVSMGNPHALTIVDDLEAANVAEIGPQIEAHERFPQHVNAGFMQVLNPHEIKLRVYERGAGETLSCGTGACAAVVSGIQLGLLQTPVLVNTRGGQLNIEWLGIDCNNKAQSVLMTGAAEIVFDGQIEI